MNEWQALAERLVNLDLQIEDRDAWATAPEDLDELKRLEQLRDELHRALATHEVSRGLRTRLETDGDHHVRPVTVDPRD